MYISVFEIAFLIDIDAMMVEFMTIVFFMMKGLSIEYFSYQFCALIRKLVTLVSGICYGFAYLNGICILEWFYMYL